jgi:hypothetical protein
VRVIAVLHVHAEAALDDAVLEMAGDAIGTLPALLRRQLWRPEQRQVEISRLFGAQRASENDSSLEIRHAFTRSGGGVTPIDGARRGGGIVHLQIIRLSARFARLQ